MTPTRRQVLAWSAPVVALTAAAPAYAVSATAAIAFVDLGSASGGTDLVVRERKFAASLASPPNTSYLATTRMVLLRVLITLDGVALPGATVTFVGDDSTDAEGNLLVALAPATQAANVTESATKRTATATSDANGFATVSVATASYSAADAPPRSGTILVTLQAGATWAQTTRTLTYTVVASA